VGSGIDDRPRDAAPIGRTRDVSGARTSRAWGFRVEIG
jgi:hypothetical protein